ncbi:unnamed protein product [Polarella glacialis]|uniref:Uncharacterized protein n=1 Tax=Polarella glacialis TaxID=89957 RepID=A0A813ITR4_POLGL|nr:unnamed protein product [Polarella glacialis]
MERHVAPLTGPAGSGPATAAALQRAAASASPALAASLQEADGLKAWLGTGDDALSAAPPPPKPSRGSPSPSNGAKTAPREVPASVVAAAAAVGQALRNAPQTPFLAMAARASSPPRTSTGSTAPAGGESVWLAAPSGVSAQSRLIVDLPDAEFTYIERPWSHFVTRWAAIDVELEEAFGEEAQFSVIDLGSCCGFFSLQAAAGYPQAFVIGVEGSVGVGNGTTGVEGTQEQIIETKAIQTHLKWVQKLGMTNCLVAPDVWDYHKVCSLAAIGQPICDVMFLLSVVHHVDNVSAEQYEADGLGRVEGTVSLMAKLLQLSPRHFVELPDKPWLDHIYAAFGTARAFLDAAAKMSGRQWSFVGPLCVSEWYGRREVWLLEEVGIRRPEAAGLRALSRPGLEALFPRVLPSPASTSTFSGTFPSPPGTGGRAVGAAAPALSAAGYKTGGRPSLTPQEELGAALLAAPTALIAAHLQLRDAMVSAETLLREATTTASMR